MWRLGRSYVLQQHPLEDEDYKKLRYVCIYVHRFITFLDVSIYLVAKLVGMSTAGIHERLSHGDESAMKWLHFR